jgi:hypothetical protein
MVVYRKGIRALPPPALHPIEHNIHTFVKRKNGIKQSKSRLKITRNATKIERANYQANAFGS